MLDAAHQNDTKNAKYSLVSMHSFVSDYTAYLNRG